MKKLLIVSTLAALLTTRLAETQPAPDAPQIQALLVEFLAGASRNDAAVHDRFWADSLVYTRSTGRRIGKADLMKEVRSTPAAGANVAHTAYSAEEVRIQQFGDAAVVAFRLIGKVDGAAPERTEFLNTGTLVKRGGRWQAVAWQATRIPLPEAEGTAQAAAADAAFHGALLAADVKALEVMLDDGFAWIHSDGRRMSGGELLDQLRSGALRYAKLDRSDVTTAVIGTTAVCRGASSRQRSSIPEAPGTADPEPRSIFYTLTLAHDGTGWKAIAMHTSRR